MAKIVLGIATSHGPMLSTPPEQWNLRAIDDRAMPALWYHSKSPTASTSSRGCARRSTWKIRSRSMSGVAATLIVSARSRTLAQVFAKASPDVAVIIGDDQMEIFTDYGMPAFSVYYGETIENIPFTAEQKAQTTAGMSIGESGHHGAETEIYRGAPALARHLIGSLVGDEFDIAAAKRFARYRASFPTSGIPDARRFHLPPDHEGQAGAERSGLHQHLLSAEPAQRQTVLPIRQGLGARDRFMGRR